MASGDNDAIDKHGMLTEYGRQTIRLAMRDPEAAYELFSNLRQGIFDKIKKCEEATEGYQRLVIQPVQEQSLTDMFLVESISVMRSITGIYRDISAVLDIEEIVNQNTIEAKPSESEIQDAVKFFHQNKNLMKWIRRDLDDKAVGVTED